MIIFEQSLYCLDSFTVYEYPATIVNSDHNLLRNDWSWENKGHFCYSMRCKLVAGY